MKTKIILLALVSATFGFSAPSVQGAALAVNYDHAGLTQIRIERGQLHYIWHTQRHFGTNELAPSRQDMTNYDRHEVHIWLTGDEIVSISKWMEGNKVFDLPSTYPSKAEQTYGSAFQTTLSLTLEDRKHNIGWTGDSTITEALRGAEKALIELCEGIRKDREK